ncbi:MAG TPA: hypothetical protein VJQ82_22325 [Terriglobales bacterium]|nr:hypothetical protein [Terriglobales bacterium]
MKNPLEVLRQKEQELSRVKEEVAALRMAAHLLSDQSAAENDEEDDAPRVVEMP